MRVRWDFFFECSSTRLQKVYRLEVRIPNEQAEAFGLPSREYKAVITIEPDESSSNPTVEQTGQLTVTLPGNKEQTKSLAFWLAGYVAQQITITQGQMEVLYKLITGEHLPDTLEEAEQLGETPFFAETNLAE